MSTALPSPALFPPRLSHVFAPHVTFSPQYMPFSAERRFNSLLREDTRPHEKGGDEEVWDSPPAAVQQSGTMKQGLHGRGARPRGQQ